MLQPQFLRPFLGVIFCSLILAHAPMGYALPGLEQSGTKLDGDPQNRRAQNIPNFTVQTYESLQAPAVWTLQLIPPLKHHFNLEAPMEALIEGVQARQKFSLRSKSKGEIVFNVSDPTTTTACNYKVISNKS